MTVSTSFLSLTAKSKRECLLTRPLQTGLKNMNLLISDFATSGRDRRAVAISRDVPPGFAGRHFPGLAYPLSLDGMEDDDGIWQAYKNLVLITFDPSIVIEAIGNHSILIGFDRRQCRMLCRWMSIYKNIDIQEL
jgi:hypothetical protein